jgi:hypothetical protein
VTNYDGAVYGVACDTAGEARKYVADRLGAVDYRGVSVAMVAYSTPGWEYGQVIRYV